MTRYRKVFSIVGMGLALFFWYRFAFQCFSCGSLCADSSAHTYQSDHNKSSIENQKNFIRRPIHTKAAAFVWQVDETSGHYFILERAILQSSAQKIEFFHANLITERAPPYTV